MANYVEQVGARELQWDLPRLFRNPLNIECAAAAGAKLSPTAVLPACYILGYNHGSNAYPFRWTFGSDTAMGWDLYITFGNPGFTPIGSINIGNTSITPNWQFEAQVVAAPGVYAPLTGGFIAANSWIDLLPNYWYLLTTNQSLALVTSAVVANTKSHVWW